MHVHQTEADRLTGLLTLDAADQLLTSSAIRTPAIRLARDGAVLPESSYTRGGTLAGKPLTGLVDPRKALALFDEGATIVFQGLQRYWQPITDLVASLELELGHPCQANAYLTPPGAQGFAVHADTHDVFVFQTHGSKQWEIHTDDGVEDLLLVPGLSVYLPTGTKHAARAQQEASLHVTIGINQLTWRGLVERAVRPLLDQVADSHLPAGYLDDPSELSEGLADRLGELAEAVRRLDPAAATASQVDHFLAGRSPRLRGGLTDVLLARDLTDETSLQRRPGHPCVLRDRGERLVVLLGDRSLEMPGRLRRAMEIIQQNSELRPSDLGVTGLDEPGRLVLCRRLVREGLLEART